jgi:pimeloyl-ACP methyl ester carboxylesterase
VTSPSATGERFAEVGGVTLAYETFGDPADTAVLLIMGLGSQMILWPEELCEPLAAAGYHVIRFDNRDVGRSTILDGGPPPDLQLVATGEAEAPYLLEQMAEDAVGLLDALGIERAHIVGASMGGMIAQTIAAQFPDRVLSLASIMSYTGHLWKGTPAFRIYPILIRRPAPSRARAIESAVSAFRLIGSPGFPFDEPATRELAGLSYDRGYNPAGTARQLMAIVAGGDRSAELRRISAPTVVIHGTKDRMVRPAGGRATATAIPGARLVMIDGMGHDLPRDAWDRIVDAIAANAETSLKDTAAA